VANKLHLKIILFVLFPVLGLLESYPEKLKCVSIISAAPAANNFGAV